MAKRSKVPEGGYRMSDAVRERYNSGVYNTVLSQTRRMLDKAGVKHNLAELPGERKKRLRDEKAEAMKKSDG